MNDDLMSADRLERGYVIVLPGIEGRSFLNRSIVRGLVSAGVPYGIEIHDWTYGFRWYLWNLRDCRRHNAQAEEIAGKIIQYRAARPSQPVYLIGHSGGGAMALFALERLPEHTRATGGILVVPAISPRYDLQPALSRTTRGIWNFSSWGDLFLAAGTMLLGSCDGRHRPAAGVTGFSAAAQNEAAAGPRLHEMRYRFAMLRHANLADHFTPVNPRFVRHWIAPIVMGGEPT